MDEMIKVFVLDTNVLIHNPRAIYSFGNNYVVIPLAVIEELDKFKNRDDETGKNARTAAREINKLMGLGKGGVRLESGGMLFIDFNGKNTQDLPMGLDSSVDNSIILIAKEWQEKENEKGKKIIIITNDVNLSIKAKALKVEAQEYRSDKKIFTDQKHYSGIAIIDIPDLETFESLSDDITTDGQIDIVKIKTEKGLFHNQSVIIRHNERTLLCYYKKDDQCLKKIRTYKNRGNSNAITPCNVGQKLAYNLLVDEDIKVMTIQGPAGTGKTLITLLAAISMQRKGLYESITVYRPTHVLGNKVGYLPGDLKEKFAPWSIPINNALELLQSDELYTSQDAINEDKNKKIKSKGKPDIKTPSIEVGPISYIRGLSLPKMIIIVDEAQNLSPKEMKAIVTRLGKGSKIIIIGDISQIDNPYLDRYNNGLAQLTERFKDQPIFAHIELTEGERSEVANLAAVLL